MASRGFGPVSVTLSLVLLTTSAAGQPTVRHPTPGPTSPPVGMLGARDGGPRHITPKVHTATPTAAIATPPVKDAGRALAAVLPPAPYKVTSYSIRDLAPGSLPYVSAHLPSKRYVPEYRDASGIPMKKVGTKLYYSPAGLLQLALRYEDAYRRTKDQWYLDWAAKIHRKAIALGVASNNGLYIPYRYSFKMHGLATEGMKAPWYSAMAQGLALSLAVRLYRDTGDAGYLTDATKLFNSFRHVGRGPKPWVTYIDAGRYLWLEEYPGRLTPSDHSANGFFFAVFGLYDYYQETRDPWALRILRAGMTTMRRHISEYRRPGTYSKYCLRHGKPQAKYHKIVTWQLEFMYKMSGDPYFLRMSKSFYDDYH